jgi:hypothetical protein
MPHTQKKVFDPGSSGVLVSGRFFGLGINVVLWRIAFRKKMAWGSENVAHTVKTAGRRDLKLEGQL